MNRRNFITSLLVLPFVKPLQKLVGMLPARRRKSAWECEPLVRDVGRLVTDGDVWGHATQHQGFIAGDLRWSLDVVNCPCFYLLPRNVIAGLEVEIVDADDDL